MISQLSFTFSTEQIFKSGILTFEFTHYDESVSFWSFSHSFRSFWPGFLGADFRSGSLWPSFSVSHFGPILG